MSLFGKEKSTKEIVRDNKRQITRDQHSLDRTLAELDREEKRLAAEIKKLAKAGQNSTVKVLAQQIVRVRKQKEKIYAAKGQLSSVGTKVTTMQAQQSVSNGVTHATHAMAYSNSVTPLPQMQRTMVQYQKQNEMAEMKEEMMDDMFEDPEEDEQADEELSKVMDSIGLEVSSSLPSASKNSLASKTGAKSKEDAEVEKLLQSLP
jgi:division protein CdvB (Snf7/Vps24/ESCRT-III family)